MVRVLAVFALAFMLAIAVPPSRAWAQGASRTEGQSTSTFGPRKQVATIIFSGLAGAILGLSTLSFYGRPQDKLSNIAVGFALGIIVGTSYTTYKAATQPREFYDQPEGGWLVPESPEAWRQVGSGFSSQAEPQWTSQWSWTF